MRPCFGSRARPSALALVSEVNPVYCRLDPRRGAAQAVAEAVRNLACVGAEAVGPDRLPQFRQPRAAGDLVAVPGGGGRDGRGLPGACGAGGLGQRLVLQRDRGELDLPDAHRAVVGLIETLGHTVTSGLRAAGEGLFFWARISAEFGGSLTCGSSTASSRDVRPTWTSGANGG